MKSEILMACVVLAAFRCSKDDDDKKAAPVVAGPLAVSLLASDTITDYNQYAVSCTSDANSGLFSGTFSGDNNSKLEVKIKGFSTQGGTYTCKQSTDNVDGDVGQKFDGCEVEINVPDATSGVNTYSMYRSAETVKAFTYAGACTVTAAYAAPKVTLTVDCADMVQTMLQGAARNPIDTAVTARVRNTTVVSCSI